MFDDGRYHESWIKIIFLKPTFCQFKMTQVGYQPKSMKMTT
jgi:hypothetical protein